METFYPSCNFARISPKAAKAMRLQMKGVMDVAGCCLRDKRVLDDGDVGIYLCQSCREHVNGGATESLWPWLLRRDDFEWPSYEGLSVIIQDCWRDRDHPEVHAAVREALDRMGVAWTEPDDARERADFCGTRHVVPHTDRQRELMRDVDGFYVRKLPEEVQAQIMAERVGELETAFWEASATGAVSQGQAPLILTYCNACTQGLQLGGANVVHLGELVMGTFDSSTLPASEPAALA